MIFKLDYHILGCITQFLFSCVAWKKSFLDYHFSTKICKSNFGQTKSKQFSSSTKSILIYSKLVSLSLFKLIKN